jgi:hypothetical protein
LAKEETVLLGTFDWLTEITVGGGWTKVMRISSESCPLQIMIDQKLLENVEYFNCLGSMITNDSRCTREIKCRIAMEIAAFNRKKTFFTSKLDLNLRNKPVKCYFWSIELYDAKTRTLPKLDQKYLENFKIWLKGTARPFSKTLRVPFSITDKDVCQIRVRTVLIMPPCGIHHTASCMCK